MISNWKIDKTWTLFLDRDGVINNRLPNQYVKSWDEFEFSVGALKAIKCFNNFFGTILIVTNQQGIGKNLMSENDLHHIHTKMLKQIEAAGGRIDGIYYCPDLKTKTLNCRKPNVQMGIKAQQDFPAINFKNSIIVGDSISDMEFGFRLGMKTIFIKTKSEDLEKSLTLPIDYSYQSLYDFASVL